MLTRRGGEVSQSVSQQPPLLRSLNIARQREVGPPYNWEGTKTSSGWYKVNTGIEISLYQHHTDIITLSPQTNTTISNISRCCRRLHRNKPERLIIVWCLMFRVAQMWLSFVTNIPGREGVTKGWGIDRLGYSSLLQSLMFRDPHWTGADCTDK